MALNDRQPPEAPPAPPGGWGLPEAAYIHVPFCRHRCGYCNFSVVANRDDLIERYLWAIDRELAELERPSLRTVYIGGGTPTHLNPEQLEGLLSTIRTRFQVQEGAEWTVEANPEDIRADKLALLARHGVNRVSLGVQSFDDHKLKVLQRGHSGDFARRAVEMTAGQIESVSVDMIFAAPGETLDRWRRDLETAIALPIRHLSTYGLTIEKGTSFWNQHHRGQLQTVGESLEVEMFQLARERTAEAGLIQYEISNFARPGFQSQHNRAYWVGRGWFAAGPGAASFVDGRREVNHRSTTTYLRRIESNQSPRAESEAISRDQYARERAAFGIRMLEGIDLDMLTAESGVDLRKRCGDAMDQSLAEGLLARVDGGRLRLTERGILFADTVAARFLG